MSDRLRIALLLAPALLLIVGLFFGGLGLGVLRSFNYMPVIGLTDPNLDAYRAVLTATRTSCGRFGLSLWIAGHLDPDLGGHRPWRGASAAAQTSPGAGADQLSRSSST